MNNSNSKQHQYIVSPKERSYLVCTQVQDRHTKSIRARWFSILIHGEIFQTPCAGFFYFYMGT